MNVVKVKLSQLTPDDKNIRTHSRANIDAVKASLKEHGQYRPFVVQTGTGRICVGNCMYTAMMELGMTEGWAEYLELSDRQFVRMSVTDNRTSELGTWDEDLLAHVRAEEFELPGWGLDDVSAEEFKGFDNSDEEHKSGASPWERVADPHAGVNFVVGDICTKISQEAFECFKNRLPETDIKTAIEEILCGTP